jgi:GH15 family glucan-1,4-alpha-glucosidase
MSWEQRPVAQIQIGNGTLLVTFDALGEIEQLFSPQIDALQARLGAFQTSIVVPVGSEGQPGAPEIIPIHAGHFDIRLQLSPGSQILAVEYYHRSRPLKMTRRLAIHPTEPILLDQWKIMDERAGLLHQSIPWMGYSTSAHCSLYHPVFNGIVHHRGRRWLGVIGRSKTQWQKVGHLGDTDRYRLWAGEKICVPFNNGDLWGFPAGAVQCGWDHVVQGCGTWGAFALGPEENLEFLVICAESEVHLGRLISSLKHMPTRRYFHMVEGMVQRRYQPAIPILSQIKNDQVRFLCERSIDVLHALQDGKTGALLAAAEVDPHSRLSGGYGYSWPRDGAYLASALGAFGFRERVEHYFRFLSETQDVSGAWWQRYLSTGHAGPSWGRIQIDEPATVLAAAFLHFRRTRDHLWLETFWPTLEKGLNFLEDYHSNRDGMGQPSHDLWEERMGIHAYSLGAVASAFLTGSFLAGELMETEAQVRYHEIGKKISALILDRFVPADGPIQRSFVSNQYWDQAMDVSLLGLIRPFGIIRHDHPSARRLVDLVRSRLWWKPTGGVLRYEGDVYRGGNPWILTTLWLGYVEMTLGNWSEAREAFQWTMSKATHLGLFPEQVHKESGKPYWVIPLGWSHAMFLLFVDEVLRRKGESQIWD